MQFGRSLFRNLRVLLAVNQDRTEEGMRASQIPGANPNGRQRSTSDGSFNHKGRRSLDIANRNSGIWVELKAQRSRTHIEKLRPAGKKPNASIIAKGLMNRKALKGCRLTLQGSRGSANANPQGQ
jgi:hypothetical protein